MKLQNRTLTVMLLILIVETQCGVIDNIYGRVKNTTSGLTQDARNVWSYSKSFVGLDNETPTVDSRTQEEKRGLIGGMFYSTKEKVHSIRNYFWNTDEYSTDAGVMGNMYNRVKNRLSKIKGSILGDNVISAQNRPPASENEKLIRDVLNKLFFANGTRQVHGHYFQETINNLRKKLQDIRNNVTGSATTISYPITTLTSESPVHHGEGLIDVRKVMGNARDTLTDNTPGLDNDIYDKVEDSLSAVSDVPKVYENVKNNFDAIKNSVDNEATELKDKLSDATAKENALLDSTYKNFNANAKKIENNLIDSMKDTKRFSY